ncbi:MAG: glycosyltransferase [Pseudomonadales bacterium]|nr:glycosyltransferase [Pseudomonadales bacterium]
MPSATLLMSVYHKVLPEALAQCLDSLGTQTRLPEQFVIVKDGPLNADLDNLIDKFCEKFPDQLSIVNIDSNQGLINALNKGLEYCTSDWVIRMDADDVAMSERIEKQLDYLDANKHIDVLGTAMLEFENDPSQPSRLKSVVSHHQGIKDQLPLRNPINHPTTCIRKRKLLEAGGYPELPLLEDYFLWAKMIHNGAQFHNLSEALIYYRFDKNTLTRRRGLSNFSNECKLRWWMYQHGLSSVIKLILGVSLQFVLRFSPLFLQRYLWHASRRKVTGS